jgi:hypothetical protein
VVQVSTVLCLLHAISVYRTRVEWVGGRGGVVKCVSSVAVAASLAFLSACAIAPDLNAPSAKTPLKAAGGPLPAQCIKDFWGNCNPIPNEPNPPPAAGKPSKAAQAAPCQKDFWGNCTEATPSLLPPSILAPQAGPPAKAADNQAGPCQKDFWGNCTQAAPNLLAPQPKPGPKVADDPKAKCVRDFWGNCTPVAENRLAYRWRYVRPGNRGQSPPTTSAGGGGVEHAGPSVVCHPKRRVIGEEQPSTEQAQQAAEQAWMGAVRYDFGERYQNLALAKEVRYTCAPSSPSAGLKRAMFRCATEAMPCRSSGN